MWTTDRVIAARPEAVRALLVDLDAWPRWGPTIARATVSDSGGSALGSSGTVWTVVGVALPFTVTEFEPGRRWAWTGRWCPGHTPRGSPGTERLNGEFRCAVMGAGVSCGCAVALRRIDGMLVAPR